MLNEEIYLKIGLFLLRKMRETCWRRFGHTPRSVINVPIRKSY